MISQSDIMIRLAEPADVPNIAAAEKAYIDCPWTEKQIEDELTKDNAVFFVATSGGEFAGYVSAVYAADECEVANVAVVEAFRRNGIATDLFSALISAARSRGVKSFFLLVSERNGGARRLYEKLGFKELGRRKNYYGTADAISMRLGIA